MPDDAHGPSGRDGPDAVEGSADEAYDHEAYDHEADEDEEFVDARLRDRPPTGPVPSARRRYGVLGAALAGAMIALRDVFEKPKDDQAVVAEAPSEPTDMDHDGITVPLADGIAAHSPARLRPPSDPEAARAWARRQVDRKHRRR